MRMMTEVDQPSRGRYGGNEQYGQDLRDGPGMDSANAANVCVHRRAAGPHAEQWLQRPLSGGDDCCPAPDGAGPLASDLSAAGLPD